MTAPRYNVLFLCTGNSARSIFAESILNSLGRDTFRAFSAGSQPKGEPHPDALAVLQQFKLPTETLRSKAWDEFATPQAPALDFVFTVCDQAASEPCPVWPGQPMTAHWGVPDPADPANQGDGSDAERRAIFLDVFGRLYNRINIFVALPIASLDRLSLQEKVEDIGQRQTSTLPGTGTEAGAGGHGAGGNGAGGNGVTEQA
jgi:arsenate reductase